MTDTPVYLDDEIAAITSALGQLGTRVGAAETANATLTTANAALTAAKAALLAQVSSQALMISQQATTIATLQAELAAGGGTPTPSSSLQRLSFSHALIKGQPVPAGTTLINCTTGTTFSTSIAGITIDNATGAVTGTPAGRGGLVSEFPASGVGLSRDTMIYVSDGVPRTMGLGMNFDTPAPGTPNIYFLDYFKPAQWDRLPATQDANGMPLTLGSDPAQLLIPLDNATSAPVKYHLVTDANMDVVLAVPNAGFFNPTIEDGDYVFTYSGPSTFGGVNAYFQFTAIRTPPTRMAFVRADEVARFKAGHRFKQQAIDAVQGMSHIRFMDWLNTNLAIAATNGADYVTYRSSDHEPLRSIPLSVCVEFCLETNVGGYFNAHHTATDQRIAEIISEIRPVAALGLNTFLEYSNELFNFITAPDAYCSAQAKAAGYIENQLYEATWWGGHQTAKIGVLARGSGVKVVGGYQTSYDALHIPFEAGFAAAGGVDTDVFALICNGYTGGTLTRADPQWSQSDPNNTALPAIAAAQTVKQDKWVADNNLDAGFDNILNWNQTNDESIETKRTLYWPPCKTVADRHGWKLIQYEINACAPITTAGSNFSASDHAREATYGPYYIALGTSPMAASNLTASLETAQESGFYASTLFSMAGIITAQTPQQGLLQHYGLPVYQAVRDWVAALPPAQAVTPLPAGLKVEWDASSGVGLADGTNVLTWTDRIAGVVATASSTAPHTWHTLVADSGGGVPAVRLNGGDLLSTTGTNAAATAMTGGERTIVVIARNVLDRPSYSSNSVLVSSGSDSGILLSADTTTTGCYKRMTPCADAGMRSIAHVSSVAHSYGGAPFSMDGINGTALAGDGTGAGGQIAIGGWQDSGNVGRADILAVLIWDRALTATELKAVHRHYCDRLGQAYPGGANARIVSAVGDSLSKGELVAAQTQSWPAQMAAGLGLPWGTWDKLAVSGSNWPAILANQMPMLGNVSALTGARNIVTVFEWANERNAGGGAAEVQGHARTVIDALHAQDPNREIIFGTSTDDGSALGVQTRQNRTDYNAFWDVAANRSGIAAYVQLHLDPNIGVIGCAPTDEGGAASTYYQPDRIHNTVAGYALIDNGPHGFRTAVQARLAVA